MMYSILKNRYFTVLVTSFLLSINFLQAQTNVSGVISANTSWTKAGSPYVVTGNILVNSGVLLTINPGVEIRFDAGKYLKIEGEISAVGLADDSILFTSNSSNKTKGSWDKIWLKGTASSYADNYDYTSGSIFKYCRFSFANEGIRLDDATIQIKNCLFFNNTYGINFKKTTNTLLYKNLFSTNTDGTTTSAGTEDNGVGSFTYCKIIENTFENNQSSGFSFGGYRNNSNNHLIKNNIVKNNGGIGFNFSWGDVVTGFANNTIEQNIVYNNGSTGIIICRDQNIIRKNLISQNGGDGIGISGTYIFNGLTIERNIIVNNTNRGIDLSSNNNTLFRYNQIIKSGKKNQYAAIELPSGYIEAKNNTISYNTISYSNYYDFNVQLGPNTITYNNFFGIKDAENYFMKVTHKSNSTITATNNYWASYSSSDIAKRIYDKTNDFEFGEIIYTSPSTAPNTTAPVSIPINIKKSLSSGRVVLTWTANTESDIAGYKIYYGGFSGYSYSNSVDAGNVLTYTLPAEVAITEDIAVTAYDASKDGTDDQYDGNESWYSPANRAPEAPTALTADAGPRRIKLTWTASTSTGVDKYNVYKSTDGINFTFLWSTKNTYTTEETRTPATKYYYKVTAFDSLDLSYDNYGLESEASSIVNAIPNRITYVSPSGSNNNIGSIGSPKLTIANSIDNSEAGDTVLLNRGIYKEAIDLKGKISLLSSLYVNTGDTNDINNTILSGALNGNTELISNIGTPASTIFHIYALTIQDVRLYMVNLSSGNNNYTYKLSKSVIKNSGSSGVWGIINLGNNSILDSCTIFGNKGRYIVSANSPAGIVRPIISNNTFYSNTALQNVDNGYEDASVIHIEQKSRVFNNLIFKNTASAIDFGGNGVDSMIFINNTIALNNGYGIRFQTWGGVYTGIVINNIIRFNKLLDISTNSVINGPGVYVKNNFFGSSGSLFGTNLQDTLKITILDTTGNIGGDPYFVDTLNNNY